MKRVIAFDTEWSILPETDGALVCLQYAEIDPVAGRRVGPGHVLHARDPEAPRLLRGWLADPETHLVGLWTHVDSWALSNAFDLWDEFEAAYQAGRIGCVSLREQLIDLARPGEIKMVALGETRDSDSEDAEDEPSDETQFRQLVKVVRKYRTTHGQTRPILIPKRGLPASMAAILKRRMGVDASEDKAASLTAKEVRETVDRFFNGAPPPDLAAVAPRAGRPGARDLGALAWSVLASADARDRARRLAAARERAATGKKPSPTKAPVGLADLIAVGPPDLVALADVPLLEALSAHLHACTPWRLRYGELLDVPVSEWPEDALRYAREDAEHTADLWLAQRRPPVDRWAHRSTVKWWERLAGAPCGRPGGSTIAHEAERTHFAFHLEQTSHLGICVDQEYAKGLRARYLRVRDVAARTMIAFGSAEERKRPKDGETWYKICQRPLKDNAVALFSDERHEPGLTAAGLKNAPKLEGLPLREWPAEAWGWISTAGHHLRRALLGDLEAAQRTAPTSLGDDARDLLKGGAEAAIEWESERIEAALREFPYPDLAAYTLVTKAHAYAQGMLGDLVSGPQIVHPGFRPMLDTGRISLRGAIRQNMPRKGGIRECFVPRPGCAFVVADYSQIELVAFAWLLDQAAGYEGPLARALNRGQDAHVLLALDLLADRDGLALTYEEGLALKKGQGDADLIKRLLRERQDAKNLNYGLCANMSPRTFVRTQAKQGSILTLETAARGKEIWAKRWEPWPYFDRIQTLQERFARELGHGEALGISTVIPGANLVRGGLTYTQCANTYFQSLVAEGFRRAFIAVALEGKRAGSPFFGFRPLLPIHDEIVAEGPAERAAEALERMREVMTEAMASVLPGMVVGDRGAVKTEGAVLVERWRKT